MSDTDDDFLPPLPSIPSMPFLRQTRYGDDLDFYWENRHDYPESFQLFFSKQLPRGVFNMHDDNFEELILARKAVRQLRCVARERTYRDAIDVLSDLIGIPAEVLQGSITVDDLYY